MKSATKIVNEVSTTGLVICPVCNRPGTWAEHGRNRTSPMVRVIISNFDALVHQCCLPHLYKDIDGQIRFHRRKGLLLGFPVACWKFMSGSMRLSWLMLRHGVKGGVAEFNRKKPTPIFRFR